MISAVFGAAFELMFLRVDILEREKKFFNAALHDSFE